MKLEKVTKLLSALLHLFGVSVAAALSPQEAVLFWFAVHTAPFWAKMSKFDHKQVLRSDGDAEPEAPETPPRLRRC